jgi:DNA-directed RNA polymerase specialized sigma24 family protein
MDLEQLGSISVKDLARACADQTSRRHTPPREFDPCYELFRRAFSPSYSEDAWRAILDQYHKLVMYWLGQHTSEDTIQDVFLRFWQALRGDRSPFTARFPNTAAVIRYLKRCAISVRIEAGRKEERWHILWERLRDEAMVESILARAQFNQGRRDFDLKQFVLSRLKSEKEEAVFELTYYYALSPREIQAKRPDLFPRAETVRRIKENLLKRLRRDHELCKWWDEYVEDDAGGGNMLGSSV